MRLFSHKHRPVHLGSYPLERLARSASPTARPPGLNGQVPERPSEDSEAGPRGMGHAFAPYIKLFDGLRTGTAAPVRAPIPDDPDAIAANIKAGIYFLDADMAGVGEAPPEAWYGTPRHRFAVIVLVAFTKEVRVDEPGGSWIRGTQQVRADLRLGNPKGSACGRCMKTCPYNTEGLLSHRVFLWAAIKLPFTRAKLAARDDKVGNGSMNPVKKWWWDLEWVDGHTRQPTKGTNARGLDFSRARRAETQHLALYPAAVMPPPDARGPVPLDRKAGLEHAEQAASPQQARRRLSRPDAARVSAKHIGNG